MFWCTGLGSNSLTGSPKRSTNGCATYTYRCHPLLTTNPGQFWGRPLQFLFVIGLDTGQLGYSLKTEGNELALAAISISKLLGSGNRQKSVFSLIWIEGTARRSLNLPR